MASVRLCHLLNMLLLLLVLLTILPVALCESFRDSPVSTTALTHHPQTLSCYAPDPSPPPSIVWLHNEIFQASDSRRNVTYDPTTGQGTYQLYEVAYTDTGQYQCLALSETSSVLFQSDVGTLTVQGQPAFTQALLPVIVPIGSQAVFQCRVVSNPRANVSWAFGSPPAALSSGGRIFLNSSALVISNVQHSDEGYYQCVAENSYGLNSTSASLSIGDPPPPVVLTISPEDPLQILEGSDITLHCTVGGAAVDTLHWIRGGVEITNQVTRRSNGLTLNLDSVTVEEGGEYSCIASSSDSTVATASVRLEVLIPPSVELVPNTTDIVVVNYVLSFIPQCNARGIPTPTITWLGPDREPLVVEDGVPVFGPLRRSSSGVYVCVATSSVGQERSQLTLTVEDVPLISVPPSDTVAAYGDDITLNCVAEGPPAPIIIWFREDGSNVGNSSVEVTGVLHLFSVAEEDSGVYICEARNGYEPPARESATLTVLSPPMVTSLNALPSPTLLSGTDFSIQCIVSAPPSDLAPISITWYQDGTLLIPTGDPRIQIDESGTLTVYNADDSYSAVYTCNASTSYAFDTAQVTVTVGDVPVITAPPSDVDLKPGEGTFIDCVVSGLPNPRIEWFVTNEMESKRQLITTVGEHYIIHTDKLELRNVTQQHSGVYECVVDNDLGRDVRSAQVRVEGLSLPLSFSPTVLIADENYTLTCDIIYNFPMATVSWRRIDGTSLPSERFNTNPTGDLEIFPVASRDAGVYECVATNEYGESVVAQEVIVHVRPTVTIPSSPLTAILFASTTLPCSVEGSPTPTQHWTLNNGLSPSGSRYEFVVATGDLVINNVQATDAGNYTCMASNEVGMASAILEVLVRGAPITNLTVQVLSATAVTLSWSHPPPQLTITLSTYHIQYGFTKSSQRETLEYNRSVNFALFVGLEEATQYQFSVFGVYGDDVEGVEVIVTVTTNEDIPTAAPQNVSLDGEVEALDISWLPPPEAERNGVIVRYDIYYRQMDDGEGNGEESDSEPRPFIKAEHTPFDPLAASHSSRVGGLEGGKRYEVKIGAGTAVGVGPNSTLVSEETLESFPLLLVLAISLPAATILLLLSLLVSLCVCYRCCYLKSRAGKHSPLVEEAAYSQHQRRQHKGDRREERIISGPVPDIPPNTDTRTGKFTMKTQQGQLLSTEPKASQYWEEGDNARGCGLAPRRRGCGSAGPHDEVLTSLKRKMEDDPYEEIGPFAPPHHPSDLPPNVRSNPLYMPDPKDGTKEWGNQHYNRLTHSDELVAPLSNQADPLAYRPGQEPDLSIMLQGGSMPHVAHTEHNTESAAGLRDKSQSLDMSANVWTGLPLIREAEREYSEGSDEERLAEKEGQRKGKGGGLGAGDGGEGRETEVEGKQEGRGEEEGDWVQVQGDGWEERLIQDEWRKGTTREAEEEGLSGEWEGGGGGRNVTEEGWQERYVGEEGEEPEITPAPLGHTENDLRASSNSLDLANHDLSQGAEPVAEQDTQNLIYATIPESYKVKKRVRMLKEAQKHDRKARKDKRKMEEKLERERRKVAAKERKVQEKERKKNSDAKLREDMGLGNIVRLEDIDGSTHQGRAQAQFIDAATAAIF